MQRRTLLKKIKWTLRNKRGSLSTHEQHLLMDVLTAPDPGEIPDAVIRMVVGIVSMRENMIINRTTV